MGLQIIKQPDGQFSIYSTVTEKFIAQDCTAEEVEDLYSTEAKNQAVLDVRQQMRLIEEGKPPYFQFTLTYEEAKRNHER